MTKIDQFIEKLITLTDNNYIPWKPIEDSSHSILSYETNFLDISLSLKLRPAANLHLVIIGENRGNTREFRSRLMEDLRDSISFQIHVPWDIQNGVNTILEWEGEEHEKWKQKK